jgi:hypothetical protein
LARRLVLDAVDDDPIEVWSLTSSTDAVPTVFHLNRCLNWTLARQTDLIRQRPEAVYSHALFRGTDGYRTTSFIWNAPHHAEWASVPTGDLFGGVEADPSSAVIVARPRGIKAFLTFDPPLSSQEIVGLQQTLLGVPGLLGHNPRTSLTPTEHAIFVLDPLKDSEL